MMYESNRSRTPPCAIDTDLSSVHKMRKAPPSPPSPPSRKEDPEIPWGDRKPAAKKPTDFVYKHSPGTISDIHVELDVESKVSNNNDNDNNNNSSGGSGNNYYGNKKHGILWSKGSDGIKNNPKRSGKEVVRNPRHSDKMSKRELCWAAAVFFLILMLTVAITAIVMNQKTRIGIGAVQNSSNNQSNNPNNEKGNGNGNGNGDGNPSIGIPPNGPQTSSGTGTIVQPRKISVREEWELVKAAILSNNVASFLLLGENDEDSLPTDLFFYNNLVSGMVFSEEERDWVVTAPFLMDDDTIVMEGMEGMSMEGEFGISNHHGTVTKNLTPNQKATAWLLFHDQLKDPNESVWRWAMASIYFKMGGSNWSFHDPETSKNKWLTSAPLCEWERIYGSSGCEKRKQQQGPLLPVELDFDATNMSGQIAIEFALLVKPPVMGDSLRAPPVPIIGPEAETSLPPPAPPETIVRSIMLSDNRLTGSIPADAFRYLMPALGKLYLDNNQLTGSIPLELGGLDTLYVQNNALTGDWPQEFCESGDKTINGFGLDCDKVECASSCCGILQCYYSKSF